MTARASVVEKPTYLRRAWAFEVWREVDGEGGNALYGGRSELVKGYPDASELEMIGESLRVHVTISDDEWLASSEEQKAALIYRTLDEHEVRS